MNRRETLKLMAVASLAGLTGCTKADVERAQEKVAAQVDLAHYKPAFFTEPEYETVKVLADLVIPADGRSGSATDAGVPAFIDFTMIDSPRFQTPMRGGLRWLDYRCHTHFGTTFRGCTSDQRTQILEEIAYPVDAAPEVSQGVAFFTLFRNLTASGFWSSKMGVADLEFMGNVARPSWPGCPTEALDHLGLAYD